MTDTSGRSPDDGDKTTRSDGFYDDPLQRASSAKQTVTNDAVAGHTVWGGAGDGNDGPTGGAARESEPILDEHGRGGERVELDSDSRDAGSTNVSGDGVGNASASHGDVRNGGARNADAGADSPDMTGTPHDALPNEQVEYAMSFADYDALTDDDEDAVNISEGDGPFLEASDDPIAGATLRKKK
jgi:hypothetical protein